MLNPEQLRAILKEYEYDPDIMNDEDERSLAIKKAMTKLSHSDRIIFCMYLELGSSRKLGKELGCSHSSILKMINQIKQQIKENLE